VPRRQAVTPSQAQRQGLVVESTAKWEWLGAGLRAAGDPVPLANTTASEQERGVKYSEEHSEARGLAPWLRLGMRPEGDSDPKEARAGRDLVRTRRHWVRQRTPTRLSIGHLFTRNTGGAPSRTRSKEL
jgi:hypothetical protein